MKDSNNVHAGHRSRVKQAVKENGFGHLTDRRLLELMLFYSIPRADTNDIARNLLDEFGSLHEVFSTDIERLTKVEGVGESTAMLIATAGEAFRRSSMPKIDGRVALKTTEDIKSLARSQLYGLNNENVILVCLDNAKRVKKIVHLSEGNKRESFIDVRKAVQNAIESEATTAFIAHNHPENSCDPSASDVDSTRSLCVMFRKLGVVLIDHIIIGSDGSAYSMRTDKAFTQLFY